MMMIPLLTSAVAATSVDLRMCHAFVEEALDRVTAHVSFLSQTLPFGYVVEMESSSSFCGECCCPVRRV